MLSWWNACTCKGYKNSHLLLESHNKTHGSKLHHVLHHSARMATAWTSSAERIAEQHSSGHMIVWRTWSSSGADGGESGTSGRPEILLAEVEEAINQQICKQIRRIPVKATNKATKTATDHDQSLQWLLCTSFSILHNDNMADSWAQRSKISIELGQILKRTKPSLKRVNIILKVNTFRPSVCIPHNTSIGKIMLKHTSITCNYTYAHTCIILHNIISLYKCMNSIRTVQHVRTYVQYIYLYVRTYMWPNLGKGPFSWVSSKSRFGIIR